MKYLSLCIISTLVFVFNMGIADAKPTLPINVQVSLISPPAPDADQVVQIVTSTSVAVDSGMLGLAFSKSGNQEVPGKNILWEGVLEKGGSVTKTFDLQKLSPGKYKVQVWFRCSSTTPPKRNMRVAQSLFVDVRESEILTSTVSFNQIKRQELKHRLEELGVDIKQTTKEQLRAAHPHLVEEIEKLNLQDAIIEQGIEKQKEKQILPVDEHGEPIRTPLPPKPDAKPTTEVPISPTGR